MTGGACSHFSTHGSEESFVGKINASSLDFNFIWKNYNNGFMKSADIDFASVKITSKVMNRNGLSVL